MKNTIILCIISLLLGYSSSAATIGPDNIRFHSTEVVKAGDDVVVSFNVEIGKDAAPRKYSLMLMPAISNGGALWDMPPVIVQSKQARIAENRHKKASGTEVPAGENAFYTTLDTDFNYTTLIPYKEWMEGSSLQVTAYYAGCCSLEEQNKFLLADNLLPAPKPEPVVEPEPEPEPEIIMTTGDKLAEKFPFVLPASEFKDPEALTIEDRENAVTIYFRQNISAVQRDYMGNDASLQDLITAIELIGNSQDSRIYKVVITGFASPEGASGVNNILAARRAREVQVFTGKEVGLDAGLVTVYNGGVDWLGLRILVKDSDLSDKDRIIEIIDSESNEPKNHSRKLRLLQGLGQSYSYMYKNYFPYLRNAAYIRIYYDNE